MQVVVLAQLTGIKPKKLFIEVIHQMLKWPKYRFQNHVGMCGMCNFDTMKWNFVNVYLLRWAGD